MRRETVLLLAAGAFALSGCQTTKGGPDYVKVAKGPELETARTQCKAYAAKASHIVIGIGGPEALVIGLMATAAATAAKRTYVFEQCMTAQGYQKAGARPAPFVSSAPASSAAKKTPKNPAPVRTAPARAG